MSPLGCWQSSRFEFEVVLSFECLVFSEISDLRLDLRQGPRVACARMAGILPSRPAWDHRAARNQARRLTEVGRLHQACRGDSEESPSLTKRPSKRKNSTIVRHHGSRRHPRKRALPREALKTLGCRQRLLSRSLDRVGQEAGDSNRLIPLSTQRPQKTKMYGKILVPVRFFGSCSGAVAQDRTQTHVHPAHCKVRRKRPSQFAHDDGDARSGASPNVHLGDLPDWDG